MATLASYSLTSLADVKESLGIDSGNTTKDNLIIRKINQATDMIEKYCGGRRFAATDYTNEEYDSPQSDVLVLRNRPINSVTSLQQRDSSLNENDWSTVETELYFTDSTGGTLDLNFTAGGHWNRYRVTYNAGYTTIPNDLAEACATLAAFLVQNGTSGTNVKSKQEGRRKIEYFDSSGNGDSLFKQLGIDEILDAYYTPAYLIK